MVHNLGEGRQLANDPGLAIFLLAAMRLGPPTPTVRSIQAVFCGRRI